MKLLTTLVIIAALAPALGAQTFTVSGVFHYEDKGWGYNGWTGTDAEKPIRRADVQVIDDASSVILASGSAGQDGGFAIEVPSAGLVDIVVRVDCDTVLDSGFQRIRVTTEANAEYQSYSPVFSAHDTSLDLDIGTVVVGKVLSGGEEANPFNLLDMGVLAWEYITGPEVAAGNAPSTVRIYWPGGGGSYATGNQAHIADDDGYDDAVILHELGHVVQNQYSDSDSPGGTHFFGDSDQDPALSMGEGYATFFAGAIMDHEIVRQAIYVDANGSAQTGGVQLRMRLETTEPYAADARGAADEVAVAATLFDILDTEDSPDQSVGSDDDALVSTTLIGGLNRHRAWWVVFVGPVASAANLNIDHAWDGWFSQHGSAGLQPEMEALYQNRRLDFLADSDEPNNSQGAATAVDVDGAWRADRTLYWSAATPAAPGTGDSDWYAFDALIGSQLNAETRYPGGAADADTQCDTYLELARPDGAVVASDADGGTGRNSLVSDFTLTESGTWAVRVRTLSNVRRYGRYELRLGYAFENLLPVVSQGPTATPSTIPDDQLAVLSVVASDPNVGQTLGYAWTPVSGGTIVGSGPSVSFDPPAVVGTTDFDIELVVSDDLGAELGPLVVTVSVDPAGSPCGNAASATVIGSGKAGLNGVPTLSPVNLPSVPNSDFALLLQNALPNAPAYLVLGLSVLNAPFDQGTMIPSPDFVLPFVTSGAGQVSVGLPTPNDPAFCGVTLYWQFMLPNDPGASGAKQTSQSNGLQTISGA